MSSVLEYAVLSSQVPVIVEVSATFKYLPRPHLIHWSVFGPIHSSHEVSHEEHCLSSRVSPTTSASLSTCTNFEASHSVTQASPASERMYPGWQRWQIAESEHWRQLSRHEVQVVLELKKYPSRHSSHSEVPATEHALQFCTEQVSATQAPAERVNPSAQ